MWNKLRDALLPKGDQTNPQDEQASLQTAAAVLMVQAALADGTFAPVERKKIIQHLSALFALDADAAADLLTQAEKKADDAVDLFAQTRVLTHGMDEGRRLEIISCLWRIVDADGTVDDYEATLMRRVAGLLGLDDHDVARARHNTRNQPA